MSEKAFKPTVLVVDDEELFLRTVVDGFSGIPNGPKVITAKNGRIATEMLHQHDVDLVVTDLKMPEMDGFDLLAYLTHQFPAIPAIFMTAFGTPEIEQRLRKSGVATILDKPLDFPKLSRAIQECLTAAARGHLTGISLSTFLQVIDMDRKTCVVQVESNGVVGKLHFKGGVLVHAQYKDLTSNDAAMRILAMKSPSIEVVGGLVATIDTSLLPLSGLLLEACRLQDEAGKEDPQEAEELPSNPPMASSAGAAQDVPAPMSQPSTSHKKEHSMAAQDKLKELASIDGFAGAALFTPTGEALAMVATEGVNLKEMGILANNVLMNAQKATLDMGAGRGHQVHIEAEKAHVLVRCLNEGSDPLRSAPGKAHIHLVMVLKNDSSLGLAKMKINSVIAQLAEDFRM